MGEMIFMSLLTILFIVFGMMLMKGKGAMLIAGYNTMPKEEREQYDEKALLHFMGKMMFVFAFCCFLWGIGSATARMFLFWLGMIIMFGATIWMVIYVNTGNRFKKG